jgi:hypothetical protein
MDLGREHSLIVGKMSVVLRVSGVINFRHHERTTTAKNMGILKYHPTSLISYERGMPGRSYQTKPGLAR